MSADTASLIERLREAILKRAAEAQAAENARWGEENRGHAKAFKATCHNGHCFCSRDHCQAYHPKTSPRAITPFDLALDSLAAYESRIAELTRERDDYQARVIPAETEVVRIGFAGSVADCIRCLKDAHDLEKAARTAAEARVKELTKALELARQSIVSGFDTALAVGAIDRALAALPEGTK